MQLFVFNFPSDLFGILGIITTVLIYQQRTNDHQLIWKLATDTVWVIYYFLQGNYSVVAITLVAIIRSIVLMNHEKKWAQSMLWMYAFMAISVAFSLVAWKDWTSILTLVSSLLCICMFWFRDPRAVRFLSLPAGGLFLTNVILNQNRLGILCECFLLASTIVGIIRLDILKRKTNDKE